MIGYVEGIVKAVRKNFLIVSADHVGYKIFVTPQVSLSTDVGKPISLYIHTYVREDQLSLYGFATLREQDFFDLLISVSGIGPKMALGILSLADLNMIKSGILSNDPSVFTNVTGVGRKTAERLIIELREKIGEEEEGGDSLKKISQLDSEVVDVLLALGYSRREAHQALVGIPKNLTDQQDKVREALRALAKQ